MSVLKGGVVFAADLARAIRTIDVELDFVRLTSYGNGETSSGTVVFAMPPSIPVSGRTVIVVEDIIDSGRSMHFLLEYLQKEGVAKIVVCSLLHKPESMVVNVPINYVGFVIPNRFVIGYGLDYKQFKRNIPSIYAKK
jgi:hypoxanthine phosphoribosyltransferase